MCLLVEVIQTGGGGGDKWQFLAAIIVYHTTVTVAKYDHSWTDPPPVDSQNITFPRTRYVVGNY